jgi:hypothetical protein
MDQNSRTLIIIFAIIITVSVIFTFYRYIVLEDIVFYTDDEAFMESLIDDGLIELDPKEGFDEFEDMESLIEDGFLEFDQEEGFDEFENMEF